jgi:hypothetical protein
MTAELDNTSDNQDVERVDKVACKPLMLFKTDIDRYGRDITAMSDFFDEYVQQMSLTLREQSTLEIVSELPVANLGIINDVIHQADVIMRGNVTLLPDFENLPPDIKSKLKKGLYNVGESRQVDGNLRAVILDENNDKIKEITLKKVINDPGNIEAIRSIGNQLQMRQIYAKLTEIQEFQTYQLEKDRDRDIIVPFLDARALVLEAENKESYEERVLLLKEADGKIRTALNAVYADIETTSKSFARLTSIPFIQFGKPLNQYMGYLTSDFQIATKFVGVRMQLLEYMGDEKTAKTVLQQYQHVMRDVLINPVSRKGLSIVELMHDYFPYSKENMNCWYSFSKEMRPALESGIRSLELSMNGEYKNDVFIVSVEDVNDGEKE